MKSMLVIGMLMVAAAAVAPAAAARPQADKALQDTAAARTKSMGSGDAAGWGKYTTDDFMVIEADGAVKTKAQRIAAIKATPTAASDLTEQKWRMYGPATAVSTARGTINGKPTRITTVWVQQQNEWKVASVQLTNIAADK